MGKHIKSTEYLEALHKLGYSFRMNETNDKIEVNGEPISDPLEAEIRTKMRDEGYRRVNVIRDAYTSHARWNSYHPVQDYLASLEWNGESSIEKLASYFEDEHNVFKVFLRRWMIGAIAKALDQEQNFMLVLEGPQGIGKSFFVRWLCPSALKPKLFIEESIKPDSKDIWLRLADRWVWEVGELGSTMRKADREALKDFVSRKEVTIRKPYDRYETTKPALANLIGTLNEEGAGFLTDPTGNRRFATVELTHIDRRYAQEIDVDQLWAEAYVAYQRGESGHLTAEETSMQRAINREYEATDMTEELFWRCFAIDDESEEWMPVADIVQTLERQGLGEGYKSTQMAIAKVLKREGVKKRRRRVNGSRATCYRGVLRRIEEA